MWLTAPEAAWFIVLTTAVPYAVLTYLLSAVLLLVLRRGSEGRLRRGLTLAAVAAVAGTALHAVLLAPAYVGAHTSGTPDLTVMTLNLKHGRADATEVAALVREDHVDVLVLEEVSVAARQRLTAAGLDSLLGYAAGAATADGTGTMVFSSYALDDAERLATQHGGYRVRVHAPRPFWLIAVHPSQPLKERAAWVRDWDAINSTAEATAGARLVVGDFNATLDHRPVRDLLRHGLADAARTANAGWQPTWAAQVAGIPLITIDHVVHSPQFGVVSTRTAVVDGTDHRALVARLVR